MWNFKTLLRSIVISSLFFINGGCSTYEEHTKMITKKLSYEDLYLMERKQRELADKLIKENQNEDIIKEVKDGAVKIRFNLDFMKDHPEYDLFEIELPITTYIVEGTTIEFLSDEGVLKRVRSMEKGWEEYKE
ncbi:hypothetical protein P4V41_10265 [Fictibacillus nanhaiensis]|uniref:hypothetical protein n=1 Tax=Fictibacillus nanhaiensis TaxID=742169 RepID=UPI002E1E1BD3|nr:hypothetical protein [Fictibacillus nanhaiensis]